MNTSPLDHPWHFDSRGRTAGTTANDHVRDMILQFFLTKPGERVNRPNFGAGLLQRVFEPNSTLTAATLEFHVRAGLQESLGDLIELAELTVTARDEVLEVVLDYRVRATGEIRQAETFTIAL
jgi:phage baseplate assembly protein W